MNKGMEVAMAEASEEPAQAALPWRASAMAAGLEVDGGETAEPATKKPRVSFNGQSFFTTKKANTAAKVDAKAFLARIMPTLK